MNTCFECDKPGQHEHHVVPKSKGGKRKVWLCTDCHSKVHGRQLASPELIRAGIARAKASGRRVGGGKTGRRVTVTEEKEQMIRDLYRLGKGVSEIGRIVAVSRPTIYKLLRRCDLTQLCLPLAVA